MSIYEEKRGGVPTGRFRVEVSKGKVRKKGTTESLSTARILEATLKAELENLPAPKPRPEPKPTPRLPSLQDARKRAEGKLWHGQETELESFRKLDRIISIWGQDTAVDDVDMNMVDDLIVSLRTKGRQGNRKGSLSVATINRYMSAVSAFMNFCVDRDLRKRPVPKLDWQTEDEGRIRWLSYDEEATLMELLPKPYDTMVYIAIRTGLRASELIGLTDDQLEKDWVHLWGTGTKSGKSRSVPLSPNVYAALRPLVSEGAMPDYWQLRNEWDKARAKMKLSCDPTFVFHTCRHSYATRAIQAGVNVRVLQELMGHASIKTTLRYAHVDDQTKKEAALAALSFHDDRMQVVSSSQAA